jgi:hypothetical protein
MHLYYSKIVVSDVVEVMEMVGVVDTVVVDDGRMLEEPLRFNAVLCLHSNALAQYCAYEENQIYKLYKLRLQSILYEMVMQ